MEYGKAEGIRKKGLAGLITDNLVEGQGIGSSFGSAISDRTKATFTGIQEKFDPLNIAKTLTGGSNLAPALLGRLMGRKQSTIEHFAKPRKRPSARGVNFETGGALEEGGEATEVLGMIYEELKMAEETRKSLAKARRKEDDANEEREIQRNKAIIAALTVRKKKEEEDKKKRKKKEEIKEKPTAPAKPEPPAGKGKGKAPVKEAPKPPAKEAPKPPVKEAPKPTAAPAPKPEVKPPTAAPAPKPEVKPSPPKVPKKEAPKIEKVEKPKLGKVSGKYESGTKGVAAISGGMGGKDPGGISYGKYQLATKTGTMAAFLASSEAKAFSDKFKGLEPGTPEFNDAYKKVVAENASAFDQAQHDYIERTLYKPVEAYASKSGLDTSNLAVSEALFSQSVQHGLGGNKKIINNAILISGPNATPDEQVKALYKSRSDYISGLNLDAKVKAGILKRYEDESRDVLKISQQNADLKAELMQENKNPMTVVNNTNVNQTSNAQPTKLKKENDRPAILEKSKG